MGKKQLEIRQRVETEQTETRFLLFHFLKWGNPKARVINAELDIDFDDGRSRIDVKSRTGNLSLFDRFLPPKGSTVITCQSPFGHLGDNTSQRTLVENGGTGSGLIVIESPIITTLPGRTIITPQVIQLDVPNLPSTSLTVDVTRANKGSKVFVNMLEIK